MDAWKNYPCYEKNYNSNLEQRRASSMVSLRDFLNLRMIFIILISLLLFACSVATTSEVQQGKRYIESGYYKRAMHELLGPACDGNAEAQYAVGYMYYYGYGVAQDTDVGYFWIQRSANQGYAPAQEAVRLIRQEKMYHPKDMYK